MNQQQPRHTSPAGAALGSWMLGMTLAASVGTAAVMAMAAGGSAGWLGVGPDLPRPAPPPTSTQRR